jgi:DNA replication and repair protein RecF
LKIDKLLIRNFRNLKKINYEPSSGLNVLVGDNAQGKTNLLESIFVLATGASFRNTNDLNLVKYEEESYTIQSNYSFSERSLEARLHYQVNGSKSSLINNKKSSQKNADRLRVVLFTPDDLFLVKGSPAKRRFFLDFILKQMSEEYLYNFDNYINILKKRNLLLKREQTNSKAFAVINEVFIEIAIRLVIQRINFVNILDDINQTVFRDINGGINDIKIKYALSFAIDSDKINVAILQEALRKKIENNLHSELLRRKTLTGPHLDDLNFYQDGRLARTFASQGQQRNLTISLKLAEMYAYKKIKGFYPLFLLDEVLAELDEKKRFLLIKHLKEADFQTFLTSVDFENIDDGEASIFLIKDGQLIRKEK